MNLLAIDTSTERATVALATKGELLSEEHGALRQHAQMLLPIIGRLLASSELNLSQLDGIVFGRGPGSFTGLRIACSVAKALAYAHDLPIFPVSSLASIAYSAYESEGKSMLDAKGSLQKMDVLAMLDARMQQVYWGQFTAAGEAEVIERVSAAADVLLSGEAPVMVVGVGLESYIPQLPLAIQDRVAKQLTVFPNASTMIHLVQSGQFKPMNAAESLPVYIRNQVTQGEPRG